MIDFVIYLIVSMIDPFWLLTIGIGFVFYKSPSKSIIAGACYGIILALMVIILRNYEFNLSNSRVLLIILTKVIDGVLLSLIFSIIRKKFFAKS